MRKHLEKLNFAELQMLTDADFPFEVGQDVHLRHMDDWRVPSLTTGLRFMRKKRAWNAETHGKQLKQWEAHKKWMTDAINTARWKAGGQKPRRTITNSAIGALQKAGYLSDAYAILDKASATPEL